MDSSALIFALLGVFLAIAHLIKSSGKVEVDQREQYTKMFRDLYDDSRLWRERTEELHRLNFKLALLKERTILAHDLIEEILQSCREVQLPRTLVAFLSEARLKEVLAEPLDYGNAKPAPHTPAETAMSEKAALSSTPEQE